MHADRVDAGERRLARRVGRAQEPREPRARCTLRGRNRPTDATDPPVEPELADARVLFEAGRWDQPGGCEHGERYRDVEPRPLLAQRGRRKVHGDDLVWPCEARRMHAAANAVLRLLAGAVGQADDRERRLLAGAQVRLDLDTARLEAHERERDRASEHPSTVRAKVSRDCAAFVPGVRRGGARWPHHVERAYPV